MLNAVDGKELLRWFCHEVDDFEEYMDNNDYWHEVTDVTDLLYRLVSYLDEFDASVLEADFCEANRF